MKNLEPKPKPEVEEPTPIVNIEAASEDQTGDVGSFGGETISELDLSEG